MAGEKSEIAMIPKTLYFQEEKVIDWEQFCKDNFKTKRVLSKIVTEAMDQYIKNF